MVRHPVVLLSVLALSLPAPLLAGEAPPVEAIVFDLPLPHPDVPTQQGRAQEVQQKAARQINPFVKIFPLAVVAPLSIVGLSIADTSPFLYDTEPVVWSGMRSTGLSLMAAGMATGITFDVLARTEHFFLGEAWHERVGVLIAGIGLAAAGYALTSYGTYNPAHGGIVGITTGFTVGGAVAWNAGMVLLVVDTLEFAFSDAQLMASDWRPGTVQWAGLYAAPVPGAGVSAGISFRW